MDYIYRRKPVVGVKAKDRKRKPTEAEDSDDMYEDFGTSPKKKVQSKEQPLKRTQKMVINTDYRLMQVKSIAECSKWSILQYF